MRANRSAAAVGRYIGRTRVEGVEVNDDGVKREGVPLSIEIEQLEDAQTGAGARAQLKEALRLYFRRVMGK